MSQADNSPSDNSLSANRPDLDALSYSERTRRLLDLVDQIMSGADSAAGMDANLSHLSSLLTELDTVRSALPTYYADVVPRAWYVDLLRRTRELEQRMRQLAPDDPVLGRGRCLGAWEVNSRW